VHLFVELRAFDDEPVLVIEEFDVEEGAPPLAESDMAHCRDGNEVVF